MGNVKSMGPRVRQLGLDVNTIDYNTEKGSFSLTPLCFSFHICYMGIIIVIFGP